MKSMQPTRSMRSPTIIPCVWYMPKSINLSGTSHIPLLTRQLPTSGSHQAGRALCVTDWGNTGIEIFRLICTAQDLSYTILSRIRMRSQIWLSFRNTHPSWRNSARRSKTSRARQKILGFTSGNMNSIENFEFLVDSRLRESPPYRQAKLRRSIPTIQVPCLARLEKM